MAKMLSYKPIILLSALVLAGCFMGGSAVRAITLIPPSMEIGLKPGNTYSSEIKLYNETADTVQLYTEVRAFTAQGETGKPTFDFANDEQLGLSEWIQVEDGPIVIQPGERYSVPLSITAPENADPGGHYASIFFSSAPPDSGQVKISSKVGTLVLASVDGDIVEAGSILELATANGKKTYSRLPVAFEARFQNTGNVHLKPTGAITIANLFGSETDKIDFNTTKGATLPKTIRKYESVWEKAAVIEKPGNAWSNFWQEYSNEKDNFAIGRYTATLSITAGSTESVEDTAAMTFWVIPWHILTVWAVAAIIVILLLIFVLKKYNAWIVKKAQK